MAVFSEIREFKRHKALYESLRNQTRSYLLMKYTDIPFQLAEVLTLKEQSKAMFSVFYGAKGKEVMETIEALSRNGGM